MANSYGDDGEYADDIAQAKTHGAEKPLNDLNSVLLEGKVEDLKSTIDEDGAIIVTFNIVSRRYIAGETLVTQFVTTPVEFLFNSKRTAWLTGLRMHDRVRIVGYLTMSVLNPSQVIVHPEHFEFK